jgi:hypothetical protein
MLKYYSPDSFLSRLLPERPTFSQISPAGNSLLHPAPSGLGPAAGKAALITLLLEKGAKLFRTYVTTSEDNEVSLAFLCFGLPS